MLGRCTAWSRNSEARAAALYCLHAQWFLILSRNLATTTTSTVGVGLTAKAGAKGSCVVGGIMISDGCSDRMRRRWWSREKWWQFASFGKAVNQRRIDVLSWWMFALSVAMQTHCVFQGHHRSQLVNGIGLLFGYWRFEWIIQCEVKSNWCVFFFQCDALKMCNGNARWDLFSIFWKKHNLYDKF